MIPPRGSALERVSREEWNIGVIRQTAADIVQNGIVKPVYWAEPLHPWYGLADPACWIRRDGSRTIFAERLNWLTGRGEIWTAQLPAHSMMISDFKPWGKADIHLSYPFPIADDNDLAFTMETAEANNLHLWRQTKTGWTPIAIFDRPVIDPTFWRDEARWWLFCSFADDEPDTNLYLFHAEQLEGPWIPHANNPVKSDLASARSAGPLFRAGDRLIRPGQDSTQSYGGAVVLNSITELTPTSFREQAVRRLVPQSDYPDGLHTICPAGDVTIIDGKRWGMNLLDPARYVTAGILKRVRRLRRQDARIQLPRLW
jgi:hypothetical protein